MASRARITRYSCREVLALRDAANEAPPPQYEEALRQVCEQMEKRLVALKKRRKKRGSGWRGGAGERGGEAMRGARNAGAGAGTSRGRGRGGGGGGGDHESGVVPVLKQLNLILNSVTDKNVAAVCAKIKGLTIMGGNLFGEHGEHMVDQLVRNAVMQPLYADVYVQIMVFLIEQKICTEEEIMPLVRTKCADNLANVVAGKLNKRVCQGVGGLYAQLCLQSLLEHAVLDATVRTLCDAIEATRDAAVQEQVCETIMSCVQKTLDSLSTAERLRKWDAVLPKLSALWGQRATVNMRVRVRMFDLRDAFAMQD